MPAIAIGWAGWFQAGWVAATAGLWLVLPALLGLRGVLRSEVK